MIYRISTVRVVPFVLSPLKRCLVECASLLEIRRCAENAALRIADCYQFKASTLLRIADCYQGCAQNMRRTCCNMVVSVGRATDMSTTLPAIPTLPLGIKNSTSNLMECLLQMHFCWLFHREREWLKKLF